MSNSEVQAVPVVVATDVIAQNISIEFTSKFFVDQLSSKVTQSNAKLLFASALTKSGVTPTDIYPKDQAHSICMALINKGGPSFQIGAQIFKKYLQ